MIICMGYIKSSNQSNGLLDSILNPPNDVNPLQHRHLPQGLQGHRCKAPDNSHLISPLKLAHMSNVASDVRANKQGTNARASPLMCDTNSHLIT